LFIGGTGFISTSVSALAVEKGVELYLLNRGRRQENAPGTRGLVADMEKPGEVRAALGDLQFDSVVDWIAFKPEHIRRDFQRFKGRTKQYVFISSAAVYQKPPTHYVVTESTPLSNPHWQYGRDKIACEELLMQAYREEGFPVTIVRPALTYAPQFPIAIGGWGCYTLADRMKRGLPIIVHGDGSSLWVVTHSKDFGRGLLGLLGNPQALGHAFHITTDEVLTWNQIYETIADALGVVPNIVHIPSDFIADVMPSYEGTLLGDKSWSTVFDNSKIKSFVPGFQAVIPFHEGIRRTVAWFDADPARKRVDPQVNAEMDAILEAWSGKRAGCV
jgi:nucleoside-diphosphate-sugar epimerase